MINRDIDFYNNPIGNNISSSWIVGTSDWFENHRYEYSKFQISEFPD